MKKLIILLTVIAIFLVLAACADSGSAQTDAETGQSDLQALPTVLDQNEYVLYQNIFYNNMADDYIGQTVTKEGTFTRLTDAINGRTRYYVWGYMDATKCCDWQWEFVPTDPDSLPANGSLVKMTGTIARDEAAMDGIWFTDASVELVTAYTSGSNCNVDMTTMDSTLERVQLQNMQCKPGDFKGQTLRIYGRVLNPTTIQHPYYDNVWTQPFSTEAEVPAIGTMVILTGSWQGDTIQVGRVEATADY